MLKNTLVNQIKKETRPVVICGAGIVGEVLLSICEEQGIPVECFCDNSEKVAQSGFFCGKKIIYTPELKKHYREAVFIISAAAIKDAVDRLRDLGYSNWYAGGLLLKDVDVTQSDEGDSTRIDYTKFAIENCILCHDGYLNPDQLFLRSIDLIITERCSLKCKDCSNLMQYYQRPRDCNLERLLESIDVFCKLIDEVMDFRIIGGDAFMNKDWPSIVKRLISEPKVKRIVLYTNGTLIPKEQDISSLQNDKVLVIITDYGALSKKLVELKQILEANKIAYHVLQMTEWLDCAAIKPHHRSLDESIRIFKVCCAKNMATLSDGKLFRCPYAANAARLMAIPDNQDDYIDLFQEPLNNNADIYQGKSKIRHYLLHKKYLKTCDYCNGRPLSGQEVQPAVQVDKPLAYHQYKEE